MCGSANTERGYKMALVRIKEIKQGIEILKEVLKKLDEIYHVLHDDK